MMADGFDPTRIKALVFDVFGTVVDWRGSIIREGESRWRERGLDLDWHLGVRAAGLDTDRQVVVLDRGDELTYDGIVIATGASPRHLPGEHDHPHLIDVRTLDDSPHGVYFVDLKEDATGRACVTEINAGRCGTTVHFYTEAGFNFPWLLVCLARGLASGGDLSWLPRDPYDVVPADLYWVRTLDCGPVLVRGDAGFSRYEEIS